MEFLIYHPIKKGLMHVLPQNLRDQAARWKGDRWYIIKTVRSLSRIFLAVPLEVLTSPKGAGVSGSQNFWTVSTWRWQCYQP